MNDIDKIIESIEEIPSLPTATLKIMNLTDSETSSAGDLAKIINMDQGLTVKVLRLTNSAFYGLSTKVTSIKQAVALIGFKEIRNISLSTEFSKSINKALDGYLMGRGELWKHAVATATIASNIAKKKEKSLADTAFTAGMVHNIGRILLSGRLLTAFSQVKALVTSENIPFNEAEKKVIGMDHAEAGAKLAVKWGFPEDLVEAIKFHHEPGKASFKARKLVSLVHIADIIVINGGVGVGGDGLNYQLDESALRLLNIKESAVDNFIMDLQTGMKNIEDFVRQSTG